jgi:hypothetical protein
MNIIQYKGLRQQLDVFKKIEEQINMSEVVDRVGIELIKDGEVTIASDGEERKGMSSQGIKAEDFLDALKGEDEK